MAGNDSGDTGGQPDSHFLDRWSQRKTAARSAETGLDPLLEESAAALPVEEAAAEPASQPELTDADMPPIDALDKDSDFSVFMSPGVSEQLRTLALRKLFHLPAFNITDGLNDYDEDYTQFAGLGGVVTHEMKRLLKRELEAKAAAGEEPVPVTVADDAVAEKHTDMDDDAEETVS